MSIIEFLLARIADDEAALAPARVVYARGCQECAFLSDYEPSPYSVDRLRAECIAKLQIINGMEPFGPIDDIAAPEVLALLAVPYADHPDYRQEWRP